MKWGLGEGWFNSQFLFHSFVQKEQVKQHREKTHSSNPIIT